MNQILESNTGEAVAVDSSQLTLSIRQIETGEVVAFRPFSKQEMDSVTSSYLPNKQAKLEYKAAELVEKSGISSSYTDLYMCLESDGVAHIKSNFENGEYAAQMVHRRHIIDNATSLGKEAHLLGLRHPLECAFTRIILDTETAWWPNQTEDSAKQTVLDAWTSGWNSSAEVEQKLAIDADPSPGL